MLFNTAWQNKPVEVQPQPDLLSTASLVAWLEKQPAGSYYTYASPRYCLLGKYFKSHGEHDIRVGQLYIEGGRYHATRIPSAFYDAVTPKPHTYGAALNRLKAFV